MKKCVGQNEQAIAERFFFALQELKRRKVIRGKATFYNKRGMNHANMYTLEREIGRRSLRTEYLAFLAEDYGVSCEWLLLGNGEMFVEGSPAIY